jgi:hypothetical protein
MGGQACILYGGAEFSRDIDFAVAVDGRNLDRLRSALADLRAEPVFFPPLSAAVLRRGHACHFRCRAAGMHGLRVDVMSRMRGAAPFSTLWRRRHRMHLRGAGTVDVVSLEDLVRIKKTQRDKDWLMVRNLLEADIAGAGPEPPASRVRFWLRECRTPAMLRALARAFPLAARRHQAERPALRKAVRGDLRGCGEEMKREEAGERRRDRAYWRPLRAELEGWRRSRVRGEEGVGR